MANRFAGLNIGDVVLHQVPGRASGTDQVVLSDVATSLLSGQREYIQQRIRGALARYARPIVEIDAPQYVPDRIRSVLSVPGALVSESRAIATHLSSAQPAISPGGIVVVARCSLAGVPAVLIAKLEHELGVRAQQTELANGSRTFDVQLLNDLLFTGSSKVFKVAVMMAADSDTPLVGHLVDTQAAGYGVAQYFVSEFLGCGLTQRADRLTEMFFDNAEKWLNRQADPEKRGRYQLALMSEMLSNVTEIAPDAFASRYLDFEDRDSFGSALASNGAPEVPFTKDTTLIQSRLGQVRVDTASGVLLAAPKERFEDGTVVVRRLDDERAEIVVTDEIAQMSGRRKRLRAADDGADVW